ncbi:unnamed protein product [Candidula unifasciata]|uniref:Nose resistant-to-fluoxetine protein N-terminal domain-containing protein n=1 Tax=Candidula unifasciata TaxID=100452 RepID=A0A8S4A2Z4_9EUPU|nr:unnamed protein product [Candidula unifasciata]
MRQPFDVTFPRPKDLSLGCYQNLLDFLEGLVGVADGAGNLMTQEWAWRMLDAFGKPSAGLLEGVFQWVGNYEECLGVQAEVPGPWQLRQDPWSSSRAKFGGKYCRLVVSVNHIVSITSAKHLNKFWLDRPPFPTAVKWGLCVPDTCSSADVETFLTKGTLAALNLPVKETICFEDSQFSEDTGAVAIVVFLCVAVAVVIICTLLDIYYFRPWRTKDEQGVMDTAKDGAAGIIELHLGMRTEQECQTETSLHQTPLQGGIAVSSGGQSGANSSQQGTSLESHLSAEVAASGRRKDPNGESATPDTNMPNRLLIVPRKTFGTQLIQGMSLYRNLCHLVRKSRSQGTFDCIQGMRVISLAWIVVGHCYTYGGMLDVDNLVFENSAELVETSARLSFHIVGSAQLAVDTFFVISGCLTMLVTLRLLRRHKPGVKFWSTFLFHRFWRLTPMYMLVLFLGMTLYEHIVQGPLKSYKLVEFEQCRHKWWAHLLYINNFYKPHSKCMTWSWFMAVDMQLFLVSPIFIYTTHRNLRAGVGSILLLLVLGVTFAFVSEYIHGGQFVLMDLSFLEYWTNVYTMPWARASVFAVGLGLGVALYKHSGKPLISKRKAACVWVVVTALSILLVLINHSQWKHGSKNWDQLQQSFFESLARPTWAVCMAWVIFACCTDLGGYANVILSWRPFLVLSRLTYSLYLLHPLLIMFVVYSRRTTIYLDPANLSLVYNYIGNLILSFLLSAVFSLIFEMPMAAMENIFWRAH